MSGLILDAGRLTASEVSCGVCRRESTLGRQGIEEAKELARSEGWRFCGQWGWCCGRCAFGSPGVYVLQLEKFVQKRVSRAVARASAGPISADRNDQLPLFEPSSTRGFGWESVRDVLDRLLLEEPQGTDDPLRGSEEARARE